MLDFPYGFTKGILKVNVFSCDLSHSVENLKVSAM